MQKDCANERSGIVDPLQALPLTPPPPTSPRAVPFGGLLRDQPANSTPLPSARSPLPRLEAPPPFPPSPPQPTTPSPTPDEPIFLVNNLGVPVYPRHNRPLSRLRINVLLSFEREGGPCLRSGLTTFSEIIEILMSSTD